MRLFRIMTIGAATTACAFTGAMAADLPPIYDTPLYESVPEVKPVEIGTGWYLRGDVNYNVNSDNNYLVDQTFGYGNGWQTTSTNYDIDTKWGGGIGIGYQVNDLLRLDATGEYLGHFDTDTSKQIDCNVLYDDGQAAPHQINGSCRDTSSTSLDGYNVMANAYVDLGTYVGITPYIGGGVGLANLRSSYRAERHCNENGSASIGCPISSQLYQMGGSVDYTQERIDESTWQLSYALMAGLSYGVTQNLSVDVGYRYLSIPKFGAFGVDYDQGFDSHQIRAGLRYSLW